VISINESIGEKLRSTRLKKVLKQSDVAAILGCAPTSLTNWETGKIMPSLEVLERLCAVLDMRPLELLNKEYTFSEVVDIARKPVDERSYEEQVALNFSSPILTNLLPAEAIRLDAQRNEEMYLFIQGTNMIGRYGGLASKKQIDRLRAEYDNRGKADKDILFAYHALTIENKRAFLDMLRGLLSQPENVQHLCEYIGAAVDTTLDLLAQEASYVRLYC
jgi:transcriptional regulator with XRE-family HTH domain